MSMFEDEGQAEDWALEQLEYYSRIALEDLNSERLTSYFRQHPRVAQAPRSFAREARELLTTYPTQAFLSASVAVEVAVKDVFLRPIIVGLVMSDDAAASIADMILRFTSLDRLNVQLLPLLHQHGRLDLSTLQRRTGGPSVLEELQKVRGIRNKVIHAASRPPAEESAQAVEVAEYLLDNALVCLAQNIGLHIHADHVICSDPFCRSVRDIELLTLDCGTGG